MAPWVARIDAGCGLGIEYTQPFEQSRGPFGLEFSFESLAPAPGRAEGI
jgi:hypothetical protein